MKRQDDWSPQRPDARGLRNVHHDKKNGQGQRALAIAGLFVALGALVGLLTSQWWSGLLPQLQLALPGIQTSSPTSAARATPTLTPAPTETPTPPPTPTPVPAPIFPGIATPGDWPTYLGYEGTGFNPFEVTLTPANAGSLHPRWTQQGAANISTQPVVVNGLIYWGDWFGNEHATTLDGRQKWSVNLGRTMPPGCGYSYNPDPGIVSTASVGTINGRAVVFVGGGDDQFYALDALTSHIIWHTPLGSGPDPFIWSSPAVYNGSVYVGVASFADCPLVQGQLVRLNAATGHVQNVFYTVPGGCTGGTVWGSPTIDAQAGYVYFATGGTGGTCGAGEPLASSLIKVRAANLALVDAWQVPASQETGDRDFGNTPTLFIATRNGVTRRMVGVAHKNGVYYAFDRDHLSAGPMWETKIASAGTQPLSDEGSISPGAFDGTTLYVAGGYTVVNGTGCYGSLRALDPNSGHMLWQRCMADGPVFGAVTVAGGVVVVGEGAWINVCDALDGRTLYRYHDGSGSFFYGAASISNGVVYEGNTDGRLFALAAPGA